MEQLIGRIYFSPRLSDALGVIRDEVINAKMWEEEFHKKDYECEELKVELERLKLALKKGKKGRGRG